eukprot:2083380-Rhodomonas_salina.2
MEFANFCTKAFKSLSLQRLSVSLTSYSRSEAFVSYENFHISIQSRTHLPFGEGYFCPATLFLSLVLCCLNVSPTGIHHSTSMPVPLPVASIEEIHTPLNVIQKILAANGGNDAVEAHFSSALQNNWDQVRPNVVR